MNNKVKEVEDKLREAMKEAQKRGYIIARRITIDYEVPRCCALGAYGLVNGHEDSCDSMYLAGLALGMSLEEVRNFTKGFDGFRNMAALVDGFDSNPRDEYASEEVPYYELGMKLAEEFIP